MIEQPNIGMLLLVLIAGEVMTIYAGILSHVSTEKVALLIVAFAGLWMMFILVRVWVVGIVN